MPPVRPAPARLGVLAKLVLAARVWGTFAVVAVRVRLDELPNLVARLERPSAVRWPGRVDPRRLGRIVEQVLRVGPYRPRCLLTALVLFRLLHRQGDPAELVIGLPERAPSKDAHAWVEVAGVDVGPPPGRGRNEPLIRYG